MNVQLYLGECLNILSDVSAFPDNSVDSIVTDPPYGLSFMGKKWDYAVPAVEIWAECLRVLKPGGHLLSFAGTRTQHRMAVNIEDAGFEIRDMVSFLYDTNETAQTLIESLSPDQLKLLDATFGRDGMLAWVYGSGFPKSHNLDGDWEGWGTALKPALEPITVARKPFKGTVAANVLAHGAGALNIDGCRVGWPDGKAPEIGTPGWGGPAKKLNAVPGQGGETVERSQPSQLGRWPANLIHDGSDEVLAGFPEAKGQQGVAKNDGVTSGNAVYGALRNITVNPEPRIETDKSAARFFYCAKASKKDRSEGNTHPTVKPTDLMAYLCRLVTPPGSVVLDPFMGSGSTGVAAMREGFQFIGIEMDQEYFRIAELRIKSAKNHQQNPAESKEAQLTLFSEGAA